MKNVVTLSPNFPENYRFFARGLKKAGARVLGIGDSEYNHLHPELRENLTEYYKVSDLHNFDELQAACRHFIKKYGPLDRLESHAEYWLGTEAALRAEFDIKGLKPENMKKIRNKSEMKKVYRSIGLPVAEGELVANYNEAKAFVDTFGYPVIVKPDDGVGAISTYKIFNEADLNYFYDNLTTEGFIYIMEQFIVGEIQTFDGIADGDSNPLFCTSHVYRNNVMEIVNDQLNAGGYSVREIPEKLVTYGKQCLKAFGIKERFFHLEFFKTPSGEFVPLEVNVRPPGGVMIDMFNYACDFDVYHVWSDLVVNSVDKLDYERKYFTQFVSRRKRFRFVYSHEEIMEKYGDYITMKQEVPEIFSNAMGNFVYLCRATEQELIDEMWEYITKVY